MHKLLKLQSNSLKIEEEKEEYKRKIEIMNKNIIKRMEKELYDSNRDIEKLHYIYGVYYKNKIN